MMKLYRLIRSSNYSGAAARCPIGRVEIVFGRLRLFYGAIKDLSRMDHMSDTRALLET